MFRVVINTKYFPFDFRKCCTLFTNTNVITAINFTFILYERNNVP